MPKVYRCFTEKMAGFDVDAREVFHDLKSNLQIDTLTQVRIFCRYDVQGIDEKVYALARHNVFSEPMVDRCYDETLPELSGWRVFGVEALPGQFDQRADSCAQCIQLMTQGERPLVAAAKIYALAGELTDEDVARIKRHVINPVESREAGFEKPATLLAEYDLPQSVATLKGFIGLREDALGALLSEYGLAMDLDDLKFLQAYFKEEEHRDPTITEVRMIDTYWSDHCRHTTFSTHLDDIKIEDGEVRAAFEEYIAAREEVYGERVKTRPVTLMDLATAAAKVLKKRGVLDNLDESEEINACSIRIKVDVDGEDQDWLLMFKNETHNHPTEIEPFGGAATCLGGAIRDPLSGRAYVYQAMRVTGAGDPTAPLSSTLPGKLSQRKICRTAAAGYASYGNQIGLATGIVHELYHPGYIAKRLEIGAVVGAAPVENVVRERPAPGDVVILLGGRTGRDGCGGATGSSKSHTAESLKTCGSEVQKGNPPEERKIQRLFRNAEMTRLIKRCNDFGAGGVSVAVGELADGLLINLDCVPKKYDGLDGTELAISESQERMAVVVAPEDAERFIAGAAAENLEAVVVARVLKTPRLRMEWHGETICDISREFLDSNGAAKHAGAHVPALAAPDSRVEACGETVCARALDLAGRLNICLERGLVERFDGSIGASSVLMPFGGKNQLTPAQVMAAKLPVLNGETDTASVMAYGADPYMMEENPFLGAQNAVLEAMAKLVAAGCDPDEAYLTFQEYFERLNRDPEKFGRPFAALVGAFRAQNALEAAAIGGKDSMSGTFNELSVPPTLVSFAIAPHKASQVLSPEFKAAGDSVYYFAAERDAGGNPSYGSIRAMWGQVHALAQEGRIKAAWAVTTGGVAEGLLKMAIGNDIGVRVEAGLAPDLLFTKDYGGILVETDAALSGGVLVAKTVSAPVFEAEGERLTLDEVKTRLEGKLERVYPTKAEAPGEAVAVRYTQRSEAKPAILTRRPLAVIPVFPGTNCEYDTARAIRRAGGEAEIVLVRNVKQAYLEESAAALERAIRRAQMIVIPGGFSGGDEPDGSGKFIASFFRNPAIMDAVRDLLDYRDGLMLGICNGFQALIKLGLVPYGEIREMTSECPTLTFNTIGRHQSRYVSTAVASVKSPWLSKMECGDIHSIAVSHGEGRFWASDEELEALRANGQIAFQYVDADGKPSMDIAANPNGSRWAIEGITSFDGRVLGKMGHTERRGENIARNISGEKFQPLFEGGVAYFK